ncbi:sigma-54-dependent Fis family transcriptional regulator [Streptomyces sclerotialus]|uniref:sigma-54-dependent Fis family transcriptional regulator n=1 Tax=Streptomyces sclerotialus TaxID=1957 RepID=UPI00068D2D75
MNDWLRTASRARDDVFSNALDAQVGAAADLHPTVYESWRRSRLQGLAPEAASPVPLTEVEFDGYLTRTVTPIVEKRVAALDQSACALVLTDREGRLLRRWVRDPAMAAGLDAKGVAAGFMMDESTVGTTGLVTLLTGSPVLIRGPEHFSELFKQYSCASAPIFHPVRRALLGSVSLICRLADTTPLMLSWVTELARAIEEALLLRASQRGQRLFEAYTTYNRDIRHPIVALDVTTIITNAAAARLLGGVDQTLLWEHARRSLRERNRGPSSLTLPDGQVLKVDCRPLAHDDADAGAILILRKDPTPRAQRPAPELAQGACGAATEASVESPRSAPAASSVHDAPAVLPGLVGHSEKWRALCRRAASLRNGPEAVLVLGEPGTGRLAVAQALQDLPDVRVVDAAEALALGEDGWRNLLASQLSGPDIALVVRHADSLSPSAALTTLAAVRRTPPARLLATARSAAGEPAAHNALLDSFELVLEVPALRERLDDFPDLLARFSAEAARGGTPATWSPEAVQALTRLDWPGNLTSLRALVRRTLTGRSAGRISTADLPPEYVARAARRQLAALEQIEAQAIVRALREAGGNKHQAALALGIARSTLYRKIRALGLDLSASIY